MGVCPLLHLAPAILSSSHNRTPKEYRLQRLPRFIKKVFGIGENTMMSKKESAQKNIRTWILCHSLLACMGLITPGFYLFFREECGLDLSQILGIQCIYAFAVFILEVPSGYIADCFGRRRCIILGSWLRAGAVVLL